MQINEMKMKNKRVRNEFNSVTYVVRNMANDAFDQKLGNRNKIISKCYD